MSETKYSFINGVPIDPDPSMPAGQKRWEIVPEDELEAGDMQYTGEGDIWIANHLDTLNKRKVGWYLGCGVLAFRRPTALKEAGAGSLASGAANEYLSIMGLPVGGVMQAVLAGRIEEVLQRELTQLRTLAKEQGEALEKVEEALKRVWDEGEMGWLIGNGFIACGQCAGKTETNKKTSIVHDVDCLQGVIYNALTLIAKLKGEVRE